MTARSAWRATPASTKRGTKPGTKQHQVSNHGGDGCVVARSPRRVRSTAQLGRGIGERIIKKRIGPLCSLTDLLNTTTTQLIQVGKPKLLFINHRQNEGQIPNTHFPPYYIIMFAEEKLSGCRGEVWQCQVPGPLGHINISSAPGINIVIVTLHA